MSLNFWLKLSSAFFLFGMAIAAVQLYKSELVRDFRARRLRRKIVPLVQSLLPLVVQQAAQAEQDNGALLGGSYDLMRHRADLESLYRQAKPLFDQERETIAELLSRLASLSKQFDHGATVRADLENAVLLGQRVVQELSEIGL